MKRCVFSWKNGLYINGIQTCDKEATHVHSNGSPLCHRHFNKTEGGVTNPHRQKLKNKNAKKGLAHFSKLNATGSDTGQK